jgi:hypothetical protein
MRDAAAAQRRVAAQREQGAGVLHSSRKLHQDDQKRTANATVSSKGDGVDSGRRTTERRGGGGPANLFGVL